ncbi:hypothetical protein BT96DRAFT_752153, partial [Gymnopus androsaceus JB14]
INRHFHTILEFLASPIFYDHFVQLPSADDPVPTKICSNTKFWPFFANVIGALDGAHINCTPSAED